MKDKKQQFVCWNEREAIFASKLKIYDNRDEAISNARADQFVSSTKYFWTHNQDEILKKPEK